MRYYLFFMVFFLIVLVNWGICTDLMSVRLIGNKLEVLLKSNEILTMVVFKDEPYPLELIEDSKGYFVYKVEIEAPSGDLSNENLIIYSIVSSKQIIKLPSEILRKTEFNESYIPAVLFTIGSKEFGESVIQNVGYQFEKTEILSDGLPEFVNKKMVVLVFENRDFESLEDFLNFLMEISRKFEMSFVLITRAKLGFSLIIPYEKMPENVSFVLLKGIKQNFWEVISHVDNDGDGWIEASEMSNVFNGVLFYDHQNIPFIRAVNYPSIDEKELKTKLRDLVFEGIFNVGDMERCIELFKKKISPPWLNEYLIGKLKADDLKGLTLYFW